MPLTRVLVIDSPQSITVTELKPGTQYRATSGEGTGITLNHYADTPFEALCGLMRTQALLRED